MTNGLNTTTQPAMPQMGLNIFKYRGLFLRIVIDNNGEPWVVTPDVLKALGHKCVNQAKVDAAVSNVPKEWRGEHLIATHAGDQLVPTLNEDGFTILACNYFVSNAKQLIDWLNFEVFRLIRSTFPKERTAAEPLSGDELNQALAQFNAVPVLRTEAPDKQPVVSTAKPPTNIIQTDPKTDAEQAQAKLIKDYGDQITAIIKQQRTMTKELDGLARMIGLTSYAHRDQRYHAGNMTIGGTAACLGTKGDQLLELLQKKGVLSAMTAEGIFPDGHFIKMGYFVRCPFKPRAYGQPLCPEVLVTAMGREWLHRNACLGWLDPILLKRVLATRVPAAADMPLDLFEFEPRSF